MSASMKEAKERLASEYEAKAGLCRHNAAKSRFDELVARWKQWERESGREPSHQG